MAARAEAAHARKHSGLEGPGRNAEAAAAQLEAEVAELREVAIRVDRGYEWWDRDGFESALDAYGEPWRWQALSETVTREFVYGNDDFDVRLPMEVQEAHARAFDTGSSLASTCATG